jgi:hypothetical protein
MAVMARGAWTDERLDDLNGRVERGFGEVKGEVAGLRSDTKAEFHELRAEMNTRFNSMDARFNSMDARFNAMDERFDAVQRTLILGLVGMTASIVASVIGGVFAVLALG